MNFKVLHISTSDRGGAGLAALRLHKSLLEQGVDSKMLVAEKYSDANSVYVAYPTNLNAYVPPKSKIFRKIKKVLRRRGLFLSRIERYDRFLKSLNLDESVCYTYPVSNYDLSRHPLVMEANIIHLHWVQNFLDFETFFKRVNKPILWTFHDLNPMYGGFHHVRMRERYHERFLALENELYEIKKKSLSECGNLSVVALSSVMKELISEHEFYKGRRLFETHNSANPLDFSVIDKKKVREVLKLPLEKKIFLFVSLHIEDSEKGLKDLIQALQELKIDGSMLVCVGSGMMPDVGSLEVVRFHEVSDMRLLSLLYNVADYLVFPSKQECFPQTTMEALCCGTPVVMTPVSGAEEQIRDFNGVVCGDFSVDELKKSILRIMEKTFDPNLIHDDIIKRFSPEIIAKQYIEAYNEIMEK